MRHLKSYIAVVVQDSWLAEVKPHHPFVNNDAYVVSSDISLAGYICTHVCLFYVFAETSVSLIVPHGLRHLACYLRYDLVPSAGSGR